MRLHRVVVVCSALLWSVSVSAETNPSCRPILESDGADLTQEFESWSRPPVLVSSRLLWVEETPTILRRLGIPAETEQALQVRLDHNPLPNAAAIGERDIVVSTGLLALVDDQSEYAFVLAHEIAHIMLGHHRTPPAPLVGVRGFAEREIEADSLAIQLLEAADFDLYGASSIINKVANHGAGLGLPLSRTHPSLAHRASALQSLMSSRR